MQTRAIYLRDLPNEKFGWLHNPYYYKVVQHSNEKCVVVTVTKGTIEVEDKEDFFHEVDFIKNTLCKENGCEEITREAFDSFYKETINTINKSAAA